MIVGYILNFPLYKILLEICVKFIHLKWTKIIVNYS